MYLWLQPNYFNIVSKEFKKAADKADARRVWMLLPLIRQQLDENKFKKFLHEHLVKNINLLRPENSKHRLELIHVLLRSGADVNRADKDRINYTLLHHAAASSWGDERLPRMLLAAGAKVDSVTIYGDTPLNLATGISNTVVAKVLIAAGADINHAGLFGHTPLHRAAEQAYLQMIEILLAAGAKTNRIDNVLGESALHYAISKSYRYRVGEEERHKKAVRMLLAVGENPFLKNKYAKNCFDTVRGIAEARKTEEIRQRRREAHRPPERVEQIIEENEEIIKAEGEKAAKSLLEDYAWARRALLLEYRHRLEEVTALTLVPALTTTAGSSSSKVDPSTSPEA